MIVPAGDASNIESFVADGAYERFADMARAIGLPDSSDSDEALTSKFIEESPKLCTFCEVPTLEEYGIDREAFFANVEKMAQDALDSGSPGNTRKLLSKEDLISIYKKLW